MVAPAKLWHWSRRGVSMGVALGVFFGLLIPVAQIPFSIAAAVRLRANIPAAAASTLVTNPVTFGPVYYAAYQLGSCVAAGDIPADASTNLTPKVPADASLWKGITTLGKPLLLAITATLGSC